MTRILPILTHFVCGFSAGCVVAYLLRGQGHVALVWALLAWGLWEAGR